MKEKEQGTPRGSRFLELTKAGFSSGKAERIVHEESVRGRNLRKLQAKSSVQKSRLDQVKKRESIVGEIRSEKAEIKRLKQENFRGSTIGRGLSSAGGLLKKGIVSAKRASKKRRSIPRSPRTSTRRTTRRTRSTRRSPRKSSAFTWT